MGSRPISRHDGPRSFRFRLASLPVQAWLQGNWGRSQQRIVSIRYRKIGFNTTYEDTASGGGEDTPYHARRACDSARSSPSLIYNPRWRKSSAVPSLANILLALLTRSLVNPSSKPTACRLRNAWHRAAELPSHPRAVAQDRPLDTGDWAAGREATIPCRDHRRGKDHRYARPRLAESGDRQQTLPEAGGSTGEGNSV